MRNVTTGNAGLLLAVILSMGMCAASYFFGAVADIDNSGGICFPPPSGWGLPFQVSVGINLFLIAGLTIFLQWLNKTYNFITTTDTVLQCSMLVLICSNAYIDTTLNTSILLGVGALIEFFILFGTYRNRKSVAEFFLAGTVVSIVSMFEYASIPFVIAIILVGALLKSMSFKGFCALLIGLIAPYWIAGGFGLIDIRSLQVPDPIPVFSFSFMEEGHFLIWLNFGITMLLLLLSSLYNGVSMYAGNTKRRLLNNSTLIFGLVACASILLDSGNMPAYMTVLYLSLAVQLANLFALHNLKQGKATILFLLLLYGGMAAGMIYGL